MVKGLKRWAAGGILLREVRGLRVELQGVKAAIERVAGALEDANAHAWPQRVQADATVPAVEVTYASDVVMQEFMQIELDLTAATGQAATEEQVMAEYERRHTGDLPPGDDPAPLELLDRSRAERP